MTSKADRRSVLAGLGAFGLAGCERAPGAEARDAVEAFDLSALETRDGGRLGFAMRDTGTRRQLAWRGGERFNYCSTFKLFLAAATLERVQAGRERLDRAIPITAADMVPHAPVTAAAVGSSLTVAELCQATVEVSDNPAANLLIQAYGGLDAWRGWFRSIGDAVTTVDRPEPRMNLKDGDKDTTTPNQTVANLFKIYDAENALRPRPELAIHLDEWLNATATGPNRIKAGVPAGWSVAHKTGTGGAGQTNDIGEIATISARPIYVAVYYDAPATLPEARRDAVIADATRIAMKALGHD